jgi:hypothetical protein
MNPYPLINRIVEAFERSDAIDYHCPTLTRIGNQLLIMPASQLPSGVPNLFTWSKISRRHGYTSGDLRKLATELDRQTDRGLPPDCPIRVVPLTTTPITPQASPVHQEAPQEPATVQTTSSPDP